MTILVCGYGQAGAEVVSTLIANGVPAAGIVVLDQDEAAVGHARQRGLATICGDAAQSGRLRMAGIGVADAAVVAVGDGRAIEVLRAIRAVVPDLRTYVLLHGPEHKLEARRAGADAVVVIAEIAGSLMAEAVQWRSHSKTW